MQGISLLVKELLDSKDGLGVSHKQVSCMSRPVSFYRLKPVRDLGTTPLWLKAVNQMKYKHLKHSGSTLKFLHFVHTVYLLNRIHWLVFLMEAHRVLCEVRNQLLCIILINFHIQDKAVQELLDPATQRNTPEPLNLEHHHFEKLTSYSAQYFACASKLLIRRYFQLDTAAGSSEFKGKRLIIPVHCERLQGLTLCCWGTWLQDIGFFFFSFFFFTQKDKRHSVGIQRYETECLFITCFIWLADFGGNSWENILAVKKRYDWGIWRSEKSKSLRDSRHPFARSLVLLEQSDPPSSVSPYWVTFQTAF